jgi:hypothetical protein
LDRNLGASQIATSITDEAAYGDLYQWGRSEDGHQLRTSSTTSVLAENSSPNHPDFILCDSDWLQTADDNLWQGLNGVNNPCPMGYRLPTQEEFEEESGTWASSDAEGAFNSVLKLTLGGARSRVTGAIGNVGTFVGYRTSTLNGNQSRVMGVSLTNSMIGERDKGDGNCVRCIMDRNSSILEVIGDRKVVKILDMLGRETLEVKNTSLIYLYDDGTVEKRFVVE